MFRPLILVVLLTRLSANSLSADGHPPISTPAESASTNRAAVPNGPSPSHPAGRGAVEPDPCLGGEDCEGMRPARGRGGRLDPSPDPISRPAAATGPPQPSTGES